MIQYVFHNDGVMWWFQESHSNLENVKAVSWLLLSFLAKKSEILKGTRDCFASAQISETRVKAVVCGYLVTREDLLVIPVYLHSHDRAH